MYDRYFIKLQDVQLVLGAGYDACMRSLQILDERDYHLMERINLTFTLHNSILPRAPNLTKVKLTGNLPMLKVHFSDNKYRLLLQLIQAAIPCGDSKPMPESSGNSSLHTRRQVLADHFRGTNDNLLITEEAAESGSSHDDGDSDTYQDAQLSDTEHLSADEKLFEFDLVVDQLSGTVTKSGTSKQEDQQLAEAVFQHFRLGVHIQKHKLQVLSLIHI